MGIYKGWIDGLSAERGISGFLRGLIVSGGAIILGLFAAAALAIPLDNEFPPPAISPKSLSRWCRSSRCAGPFFFTRFQTS